MIVSVRLRRSSAKARALSHSMKLFARASADSRRSISLAIASGPDFPTSAALTCRRNPGRGTSASISSKSGLLEVIPENISGQTHLTAVPARPSPMASECAPPVSPSLATARHRSRQTGAAPVCAHSPAPLHCARPPDFAAITSVSCIGGFFLASSAMSRSRSPRGRGFGAFAPRHHGIEPVIRFARRFLGLPLGYRLSDHFISGRDCLAADAGPRHRSDPLDSHAYFHQACRGADLHRERPDSAPDLPLRQSSNKRPERGPTSRPRARTPVHAWR